MIIKYYIITLICIIIVKPTTCSIIHDTFDQESIHITKYCTRQRYCREGTHVVCMYYDHSHKFGPHCGNPLKVEVTPKMIQKILANINDIRGEVATGRARGKDGEFLPRAYGLMKLEWDKELAFLAQILANQCLGGRGDLCRATDRFPNPSQTIAIIRYKYPNWEYLKPNNTEKGLNEEKLIFAVNKFFKSTHALRRTVTKEIIMNCPPSQELPDINLKFYLNLIRGGATHIGCGISAYSKFKMNGASESMQNNVQIVCNISDAPKLKQSVYKVNPPIPEQGFTKRCGCPRGYKETRSCLCERDSTFIWKGQQIKQLGANLKQDSIQTRSKNDEVNDEAMSVMQPKLSVMHDSSVFKNKPTNGIQLPYTISKSRNIIMLKGNKSEDYHAEEKNMENIESANEFSKITNAITPKKKYINSRLTNGRPSLDLKLLKSQKRKPIITGNAFDDIIFKMRSYVEKEATTESILDVAEENLVDIVTEKNVYLKAQNKHHVARKKLLLILNSLEQEVKNLKFDDDLKQIFDFKMRKIYETGVNRGQTLSSSALNKQLNKKDLHGLRAYLQSETNESVGDEILSLRRMIHRQTKETQKEHNSKYSEHENDPNNNFNYVAQQFNAYQGRKYNNMDNSYEIIPKETALTEHQNYQIMVNDMLDGKHNGDHECDHTYNLQDNLETMNQETFNNNNARQSILSQAIGYQLDNYDDEGIELERSAINKIIELQQQAERNNKNNINIDNTHLYKDENDKSPELRTSLITNSRLQLSNPFSRKNKVDSSKGDVFRERPRQRALKGERKNLCLAVKQDKQTFCISPDMRGEIHQILLRRPNQIDSLRLLINQPRQSTHSSETETFTF